MLLPALFTLGTIATAFPATIPARPFNNNPIVVGDTLRVRCNVAGTSFDPLVNDSDPDGDTLTIVSAGATFGNVDIVGNALLYESFDPGTDTIHYTVSDGHGGTAGGFVSVTIIGTAQQCFP